LSLTLFGKLAHLKTTRLRREIKMLIGKVAVVTGSTSGIGLGIAQTLAAQGADVVLNGFGDAATIEKIRADIQQQYGVRAVYSGADLSTADGAAGLIEFSQQSFGQVDILVNNAGIQHVAAIEEFPVDRWDLVIAINLSSAFHTIRTSLPGMRQRGWGRIINIASAHGLVGSPQKSAYVAAKHGILGLTKVVALETAESGITCNAICPGWVLTPLVQKQIDARAAAENKTVAQAERDLLSEKQPTLRFTTPEQLGALTVFLCSPGGDNMTGTSLPVDGGWTAR
jgi:3-hydroxybutyrate dehydrogenase